MSKLSTLEYRIPFKDNGAENNRFELAKEDDTDDEVKQVDQDHHEEHFNDFFESDLQDSE